MRRALRAGVVAAAAVVTAAVVVLSLTQPEVTSFEGVKGTFATSDLLVRDRYGEPLQLKRVSFQQRKLHWVTLQEVPRSLIEQIVAAEDARFFAHAGVDWRALVRAAYRSIARGERQGGSTISMQLSSLLAGAMGQKGIGQKIAQIRTAQLLERRWSKEQILEGYINLIPLRGELRGIAAAARKLFGKYPDGLSPAQSSVLVAMLRSPNAAAAPVSQRACAVLEKTGDVEQCEAASEAAQGLMASRRDLPDPADAPFVATTLAAEFPNRNDVRSTLDAALQRQVAEILRAHLKPLARQNARDGAVLVVDNATGEVLAYVGNTGADATARFVDGVTARRSAGSTLKPFLYAAGLDTRLLTAASTLDDTPLNIPVEHGVYRPQDYDRNHRGLVSTRVALASSLNIPAVQVVTWVGVARFADVLRGVGFNLGKTPVMYGYSMALGTPAVSLWELVAGYRAIAQGGVWSALRLTQGAESDPERSVFSAGASFILADMLSDRQSRAETFGLENPLATRFWSAAKTGTSRDMTDNWCIGFTRRYTVGVWVGNFSGEPMWNVTGITGAAPVWVEVMNLLAARYAGASLGAPVPPTGEVVEMEGEWYLKGTEPAPLATQRSSAMSSRITYPVDSMVVAIDPEVSEARQRIRLQSSQPSPETFYVVDGVRMGSSASSVWWSIARGTHRMELQYRDGRVLDSISFVVR